MRLVMPPIDFGGRLFYARLFAAGMFAAQPPQRLTPQRDQAHFLPARDELPRTHIAIAPPANAFDKLRQPLATFQSENLSVSTRPRIETCGL